MRPVITIFTIFLLLVGVANAELPTATAAIVNQALSSGKPTLIDFGLRTCNVCKKMAPVLESLSGEYTGRASVLFIDVREDQAAVQKFRVQMIPTQIFFNSQGKEVNRHVGFMDKSGIIRGLKSAGLK